MSAQPTPARPTADRRTSTAPKRTSTLPRPSSITLHPDVLIAQHAQLTGTYPLVLGRNTVLHPHCKISSAFALVTLGEGVVVHERAKIGVAMPVGGDEGRGGVVLGPGLGGDEAKGTVLESNVVVEANAVVEAARVGEGSVIGVGVVLGRGCVVGKFCTMAAASVVPSYARISDFTVVYGQFEQRIDKMLQTRADVREAKIAGHEKQVEMYKKLIPNNAAKWA